eukprot:1196099-Prorocentrum_minimum.AAC.2
MKALARRLPELTRSESKRTINYSCTCTVVQYMKGTKVQNANYQRCEHPGFPGASSVCNVPVPWTNPSPARGTGVH